MNALENRADIVAIAAVANDLEMVKLALSLGANAGNLTSPYDGTALIAAAHLGRHEVVKRLVAAGASLDHVNNLGWTALMEAVVLGDGEPDHVETGRAYQRPAPTRPLRTGRASLRSNILGRGALPTWQRYSKRSHSRS